MTVAAVEGDSVDCLWLGEEGDLFLAKPSRPVTLMIAATRPRRKITTRTTRTSSARDQADLEAADEDEIKPAKSKRKTG